MQAWQDFSKDDALDQVVNMDVVAVETYYVRFPCDNFIKFKLSLYGTVFNSHVELNSKTDGTIHCNKADAETTKFEISTEWQCEDDGQFMIAE